MQFDYLDLSKSMTGDQYVLIMHEDHTGCPWLYPIPSTIAKVAAHALLHWWVAFETSLSLTSDSTTRFRNKILRLLVHGLRCRCHLTPPSCQVAKKQSIDSAKNSPSRTVTYFRTPAPPQLTAQPTAYHSKRINHLHVHKEIKLHELRRPMVCHRLRP